MVKNLITAQLKNRTFFGHPAGLFVLFLTEMWERFSYYGMRSLLVLYMVDYLLNQPERAANVLGYNWLKTSLEIAFGPMSVQQMSSQIYGLYTGFVYFTPFFGGIIADRYLGQYKTVYLGGLLMALGHFFMASEQAFFLALLLLILGNGAFKPNISTQVGGLYKAGDPRRDSAFTIFYMGINLGAFFSPLVCGTLGQVYGWHWGFGAAGVGMLCGLVIYYLGSGLLPRDSLTEIRAIPEADKAPLNKGEWAAVFALIFLCSLNIAFWAIYEQQGNVLQLWADKRTDWNFLGLVIPSTWYQSFNPAMIFMLAPLLNIVWTWQARSGKEPSTVTKMGIGCVFCGAAYLLMISAALLVPESEKASVMWLVSTTLVFTLGELFLSPIGLSLVTKVAPVKIVSMMMGVWFLSSFFGNYATGYLGTFYETMSKEAFFAMLSALGIGTGLIFFILKRPLDHIIESQIKLRGAAHLGNTVLHETKDFAPVV